MSPEDTQWLKAAQRGLSEVGGKEMEWGNRMIQARWLGAKIWQFFQGENCIFPINFLTAKVSTFRSTVKLYILPSTHKQLSRHEAKKNILYRGHSETEGHFLPFNLWSSRQNVNKKTIARGQKFWPTLWQNSCKLTSPLPICIARINDSQLKK